MKTYKTNIENMTVNYRIEIVRDFNNVYYVNMTAETGEYVKGLPEYIGYKELKKAVKCFTGCELPALKSLTFEGKGRKQYAHIERAGHQTPKVGDVLTDTKFGLDYERITGIEEGMNTYIVTTATKIQVECMKHYRVMERAKNEHTVADLPEWVRPGAVLMINGTWKWEEVEIVELGDGCVWYKKGNSVMGWTYDHFISLYVNHRYAKVKEYASEPTLEDIGKFRAVCEADGCTYPGDVEGTSEYYRDALLTAEDSKMVSYQFGNCRFDCKRNESGTWDVHAYDTDGEDTTFEGRTASFFGGMFNDLFKTWGSGNLPEPPAEVHIDVEPTLEPVSEIKPKAAFQIGDRVERKSDGERGTVDDYGVTDGKLTYIVKYDRTQRRQSDGFEYLSEELTGDELQAA